MGSNWEKKVLPADLLITKNFRQNMLTRSAIKNLEMGSKQKK